MGGANDEVREPHLSLMLTTYCSGKKFTLSTYVSNPVPLLISFNIA